MDKNILRDVVLDQNDGQSSKSVINRLIFEKVSSLVKSEQILILSGLRRCGKSTLLQQIRQQQTQQDYFINFDDDRLVTFTLDDFQRLYEIFIELYGEQQMFYFDEIQNISGWERFVRRLHNQQHKVFITGSNASMLSAELGTRLTGRYISIELFPFSFAEYLRYSKLEKYDLTKLTTVKKSQLRAAFKEFSCVGGLPEYLNNRHDEYLHSLYQSILNRDILVRHKVGHVQAFKELVYFLASNTAKECSYNALRKTLGLSSPSTVSDYCGYLQDCFLCFFVNRFDYSLKKQLNVAKKVYFIDQALMVKVGFRFSAGYGRLLENMVFLELKRRSFEIYYHKGKTQKKCDFVLRDGMRISQAIQVCVSLVDEKTKQREFDGLLDALKTYELTTGLLLTEDEFFDQALKMDETQYLIEVRPIWWWALQK